MSPQEISLHNAQKVLRENLERMRDEAHNSAQGERPNDDGRYTEVRERANAITRLISSVLSRTDSLLVTQPDDLVNAFQTNPVNALSEFLRRLALDDLASAPDEVFTQLSAVIAEEFDTTPQFPSPTERNYEQNIRYVMSKIHLPHHEAKKKLDDVIAQHREQNGVEPDAEVIMELLIRL